MIERPAKILVVDDVPENVRLLEAVLIPRGHEVVTASDGLEALDLVESEEPDLILLDVMMPGLDGYGVCTQSCSPGCGRCCGSSVITTRSRRRRQSSPSSTTRSRSACRRRSTSSSGSGGCGASSHRSSPTPSSPRETRRSSAATADRWRSLRRRTALLQRPDRSPGRAPGVVKLGCALREEMAELTAQWSKRGHDLDFGAGIALGYATCGEVGFDGRSDNAAIGPVTNLVARLADAATGGQVLIAQRLYAEVDRDVDVVPVGEFTLKGFRRPVAVFDVFAVRSAAPEPSRR